MNVLIYGKHKTHVGCEAVIDGIKNKINDAGGDVVKITNDIVEESLLDRIDVVIVNGEGSMHHTVSKHREVFDKKMKVLRMAQRLKKDTALINTVWQRNTNRYDGVLKNLKLITVREIKSYKDITSNHKVKNVKIFPDASFYATWTETNQHHIHIMNAGWFDKNNRSAEALGIDKNITRFLSWSDFVSQAKNADIMLTGRHHAMYGALIARTPFVATDGNTWKNSGLMEYAKVNIPILPYRTRDIKVFKGNIKKGFQNLSEYERLFDFLYNHPPLKIEW